MNGHAARTYLLTAGLVLTTVVLTGCPKTPVLAPDASSGASGGRAHRQASARGASPSYVKTTALGDLHFDVNRAVIRLADQRKLDANAAWLKSNGHRLLLEGFADERGTPEHNRALGERRAAAVRDALVAHGIEASRISVRSFGEEQPLCGDRTDLCWAKNRRVQFMVSQ
jgi:peptidoglycan-associated lipoprotein